MANQSVKIDQQTEDKLRNIVNFYNRPFDDAAREMVVKTAVLHLADVMAEKLGGAEIVAKRTDGSERTLVHG